MSQTILESNVRPSVLTPKALQELGHAGSQSADFNLTEIMWFFYVYGQMDAWM